MSVNVGSYSIGEIYVGSDKIAEAYVGSELVYQAMRLPVKTFRFKFSDTSFDPSTTLASANLTWTVANASRGLWDATSIITGATPYRGLFKTLFTSTNMGSVTCELIGANTTGITDATEMFRNCNRLSSVCKMDLSTLDTANFMFSDCTILEEFPNMNLDNLAGANGMFQRCSVLQVVPDFGQLPNIATVGGMFYNCKFVYAGALALYNILSTRITTASRYSQCFRNCGADTTTGAAELAQIPSGWK